ncbi:MAG: lipid kinase YegS [Myxococcales bacterium]|nr:lipid kinase YegS [Myxococcales bacterium]
MRARIILHGNRADNEVLRTAVASCREEGFEIDVRVTWEPGDTRRLASEAVEDGVDRLIAGGGDGTVHDVLNGLLARPSNVVLGVLPLGTANDFARGLGVAADVPTALSDALRLPGTPVDHGVVAGRAFANVATGGFGTEITVKTDPALKRILGSAAYVLTGLTRFSSIDSFECRIRGPQDEWQGPVILLAVGNARYAGGGNLVCPDALIDDGLLDVTVLPATEDRAVAERIATFMTKGLAGFEEEIQRWRVPWLEVEPQGELFLNLDGEPIHEPRYLFEIQPGAIRLAVPQGGPLSANAPSDALQ